MASGSFPSGGHPSQAQQQQQQQPPPAQHHPHQSPPPPPHPQHPHQPYPVGAMEMGLGYTSAAAAAAAMGEAYRSSGPAFGRLDYPAQAEEARPSPRRRRPPPPPATNAGQAHLASASDKQQQQQGMGQFGILAPTPVPVPHPRGGMTAAMGQQTLHFSPAMPPGAAAAPGPEASADAPRAGGRLGGKIVVDPPDLEEWRERLFNVDEMIVLTQEQFETYFPHVDNVYSHRSTQKYKRKPFISHYWDCRMKGRPPGTPKTEDPNKRRRRRSARERDLCDVKIKLTEYFPSSEPFQLDAADASAAAAAAVASAGYQGQRFWTVQRVNGNGGNGKGDGVAGPHKHTLAKSDEIKKNSVQRWAAAQDRETKKAQPAARRATGAAGSTAKRRAREHGVKLYAACYCPFSQRVWIALEAKGMGYQYCETDPYRKPAPAALAEVHSKGKVPALRQGEWSCAESTVILEYLEDVDSRFQLLPSDPKLRATCRLWIHHINTDFLSAFYRLLQNTDVARQALLVTNLQAQLDKLVRAADERGPFFLGPELGLVDVHLAPFALRMRTVLQGRRGWPAVEDGSGGERSRWGRWLEAIASDVHVKATTSMDELYADTADVLIKNPAPVAL